MSLAIIIIATLLIVIQLWLPRRTMVKLLGSDHAMECTTVIAVLVAPAAVYTTFRSFS